MTDSLDRRARKGNGEQNERGRTIDACCQNNQQFEVFNQKIGMLKKLIEPLPAQSFRLSRDIRGLRQRGSLAWLLIPLIPMNHRLTPRDEDKRRDDRLACRSPIEWAYFNRPQIQSGVMRNFSHDGASFESTQALVSGATVVVRLENYPAECRSGCSARSSCPWPRSIILGDVKWCRDLSGGGAPRYGVGVKLIPYG